MQKGVQFLEHGQYADADLNFRKAIQKDPNYGQAYYRLGLLELQQNHTPEAFTALSRAVDLLPAENEPKLKLAEVALSFYLLDTSHPRRLYDLLIKLSDQLLARTPDSFDGLRIKGVVALTDKKPADAVEYLQRANQVKPSQPDLIHVLVQALIENGQNQEAEQTALGLIGKDKTFGPIYTLLFKYYADHNRLQDAENILRLQASNNPDRADSWLQLAVLYGRIGKRDQMTAALQHLLDNPKTFPQAHLQAGQFYQANGGTKEAIEQYEAGLSTASEDKPTYLKRLSQVLAAEGKNGEALQYLDQLLKLRPQDSEALGLKAGILLNGNSPENRAAAIRILQELVSQKPDDPDLRHQLGEAYLRQSDPDAAAKEFLEAVKKKPHYVPALLSLAEISRDKSDYAGLLRYTGEALTYENANAQARLLRVVGWMGTGVYDQAQAELNRLSKEFPQSRDVQLQLGLLEIRQNQYQEAEKLFRRLYRPGDRDLRALEGLAEVYFGQNQPERAIELWSAELKRSPNYPAVRVELAASAVRGKKYDIAIAQYEELLKANPNSAELYSRLGQLYLAAGDADRGQRSLKKARDLKPNSGTEASLAYAEQLRGRQEDAERTYRVALAAEPDNAAVLNNLAFLLAEKGSLKEALQLANRAQQKEPANPEFSDTLGWIYLKMKTTDAAVHIFEGLVRRFPDNPRLRYHLSLCLLQKGDKDGARSQLKTALGEGPNEQDRIAIEQTLSTVRSTTQ